MPIVEAVAQQIISAEAEVEATQMTRISGSVNHGLEIDGITCWDAAVGSNHLGSRQKLKNSGLYFNCPYVHDMNLTLSFLYFPILYIIQIFNLQLMVESTFSGQKGRMPFLASSQSDGTLSLCPSQ